MDKRKRVRFGCTLAPDVADILAEECQCSFVAAVPGAVKCDTCGRSFTDPRHFRASPFSTRTEYVEAAVRAYALANGHTVERSNGRQPASQIDTQPARFENPDFIHVGGELIAEQANGFYECFSADTDQPDTKAARKTRKRKPMAVAYGKVVAQGKQADAIAAANPDTYDAADADPEAETVSEALPPNMAARDVLSRVLEGGPLPSNVVLVTDFNEPPVCPHPNGDVAGKRGSPSARCTACGVRPWAK